MNHPGPVSITFTFHCDVLPEELCRVKYDYAGSAYNLGSGFAVYVDDPTLTNADDNWEPVLAFPYSAVGPGDNAENVGDCDGSAHQITFVVQPGTILHLDNLDTECLEPVVSNEAQTWSTLKVWYRYSSRGDGTPGDGGAVSVIHQRAFPLRNCHFPTDPLSFRQIQD